MPRRNNRPAVNFSGSMISAWSPITFYLTRPFALLTLGTLPFMAFAAKTKIEMFMGADEGIYEQEDEASSPGGIVMESLSNIRTVASLTLEEGRSKQFREALHRQYPNPIKSNAIGPQSSGSLGLLVRIWGIALFFWWGGWLLFTHPNLYEFRDFFISMVFLLFSISGMAVAMQGIADSDESNAAAERVFELMERKSQIDPLSEDGKKAI
jgi:ATP-binding cassette subfamily B (MDR/TAP) protein 1